MLLDKIRKIYLLTFADLLRKTSAKAFGTDFAQVAWLLRAQKMTESESNAPRLLFSIFCG